MFVSGFTKLIPADPPPTVILSVGFSAPSVVKYDIPPTTDCAVSPAASTLPITLTLVPKCL